MKKSLYAAILATVIFSSCANEFNRVYKTSDNTYKYEYAKESYTNGKYVRASTLLQGLVTMQKGTENAQESLYMLGMAEYNSKDYEGALPHSRNISRVIRKVYTHRRLSSTSE